MAGADGGAFDDDVAAVAVCLSAQIHGGGAVRGAGAGGGIRAAGAAVFAGTGRPNASGGRTAPLLRGHARLAAHRADRAAAHPFHLPAIHAHAARGGRGPARGAVHLRRPLLAPGHRHGPAGERLSAGVHADSGRIAGLSLFDGRALGLHALSGHGAAGGIRHPRQFDDGAGVSGLHPAFVGADAFARGGGRLVSFDVSQRRSGLFLRAGRSVERPDGASKRLYRLLRRPGQHGGAQHPLGERHLRHDDPPAHAAGGLDDGRTGAVPAGVGHAREKPPAVCHPRRTGRGHAHGAHPLVFRAGADLGGLPCVDAAQRRGPQKSAHRLRALRRHRRGCWRFRSCLPGASPRR